MLNTKRLDRSAVVPLVAAIPLLLSAGAAQAHFKLIKPTSWIVESASGDPQKAGPCGPEGSGGMKTDEITTVEAGSMLEVEYVETIHHPGWFRISLDADRSKFEEIEFPSNSNCNYDMSTVPEEPHGNVLADGLAKDENLGGSNRMFKEMIKIPDTPCEKCTLQVIQVMADAIHAPPGCIYYHCADLKIVAAGGGTPGSAGAAAPGGAAGATGAANGGSGGSSSSTGGTTASTAAGAGGSTATTPATAAAGAGGSAAKPAMSGMSSTTTTSSGAAGSTSTRTNSAMSSATGAAGKPAASSGSAGTASSTKADSTTMVDDSAKAEQSGCAVTQPGSRSGLASALLVSAVGVLLGARRRQRARA